MTFVFKEIKTLIFYFFIFLNFNNYLHAHMSGKFTSEVEAKNRSLELGCDGIHKNQDKWLPCENEKELHIHLRK